mgnify:CR=1 FL=1
MRQMNPAVVVDGGTLRAVLEQPIEELPGSGVEGPIHVATPVFDGAREAEISDTIEAANRNLNIKYKERFGNKVLPQFVPDLLGGGALGVPAGARQRVLCERRERAERDEIDFVEAARGLRVVEQCMRCHCEVSETISGVCLKCRQNSQTTN